MVPGLTDVKAIAAGYRHTVALKTNGTLVAWGDNSYGQLGDGTKTDRTTPTTVTGLTGVTAIATGDSHTVALKEDGTVVTWGKNAFGQIGDGTKTARTTPTRVSGLTGVTAIAAYNHTVALKKDGTVAVWGSNMFYQLGDGTITNATTPKIVDGLTGVRAISATNHTVALKVDGTVAVWGDNLYGQLGDGTKKDRAMPTAVPGLTGVAAIVAGGHHTVTIKGDGTVAAWGSNSYGQLGDGTKTDHTTPIAVPGLADVSAIAAGGSHTIVLRQDGTVATWGSNDYGQLGDGRTFQRLTPYEIGGLENPVITQDLIVGASPFRNPHTMTIINDKLVAAGDNTWGQLGNHTQTASNIAVDVIDYNGNQMTGIQKVSNGNMYSLILKADDSVWSVGYNEYGKLGIGDGNISFKNVAVPVKGIAGSAELVDVKDISAGYKHSLAVKNDGSVWAWGSNGAGQLGTGNKTMSLEPVRVKNPSGTGYLEGITSVYANANYSMALKNDGTVYAWGNNDKGQLGNGNKTLQTLPVQVKGKNGTGFLNDISAIASAEGCSMALDNNGAVWTWGGNQNGRLGDGTSNDRYFPDKVQKSNEFGGGELNNIASISAGYYHNAVLDKNGNVWSWGKNNMGQLGNDSSQDQNVAVKVKGKNGNGYLEDIQSISAGYEYTMAVQSDNRAFAWGSNAFGQFGTGDIQNTSYVPVRACIKDDYGDSEEDAAFIALNDTISGNIDSDEDVDCFQFKTGSKGFYRIIPNANVNIVVLDMASKRAESAFDGFLLEAESIYYIKITSNEEVAYSFRVEPVLKPLDLKISASAYELVHTIFYKNNLVYGAGRNYYGQLGSGTYDYSNNTPTVMIDKHGTSIGDIKKVSAGDRYSLILKSDGTVWATGINDYNKLGVAQKNGYAISWTNKAGQVCGENGNGYLSNVIDISAGMTHSLALKKDGTVWAWGSSSHGQLGGGNRVMQIFPKQVPNLTNIIAIKAGNQASMALKADGTVWMWGKNDQKQLGADSADNEVMYPVQVRGENNTGFLQNIIAIDMAEKCSFALDSMGQVWSWGTNLNGVLGTGKNDNASTPVKVMKANGTPLCNIKSISAGNYHCGAVGYDGSVWMWGKNASRQLGNKTKIDQNAAINPTGLEGKGMLSNVETISCGYEYTTVIQRDGTFLAWGYDVFGQFGLGNDTHQMYDYPTRAFFNAKTVKVSVQTGGYYTLAISGPNTTNDYKVEFDETYFEIDDLYLKTDTKDTIPAILGNDVTVTEVSANGFKFHYTENAEYDGCTLRIGLKAKKAGNAQINVLMEEK